MLDCSHRWRTTCVGTGTVKKRALERRWPPLLAVLSGFAAAALNGREVQVPSCSLRLLPDVKVGPASCTLGFNESASVGECCALCQKLPSCRAFTLEPAERRCYLKSCANGSTPVSPEQGTVSGAPPPAPLEPVLITAEHGVTNTVSRWFKSWNIDASPNRQWETRDLSDPLLHYLAAASEPGLLRFGGSGNDGLRYGVGQPCPSDGRCLNETHFVRFMDFAAAAGSRLVFGLNIEVRDAAGRWDSRDAKPLIEFALAHNYSFFGFELGNEQDPGHKPLSEAEDFAVLHQLLVELFPTPSSRPKIIGPDIHGFHSANFGSTDYGKLDFMVQFVENCSRLGVPLHAVTHHEYIEIEQNSAIPPPAGLLDNTAGIARRVSSRLNAVAPTVEIWAGEIGPHNGRSPGCDRTSLRWANFANSFWYLDAMASKAANGYKAFCRQDFVGIDYGIIDCQTYTPLPDYYAGVLWGRLMGSEVIALRNNRSDHQLRAYAHCSASTSARDELALRGLTVLLINLDSHAQSSIAIELPMSLTADGRDTASSESLVQAEAWVLSGPGGTNSSRVALNGVELKLMETAGATVAGRQGIQKLPTLNGKAIELKQSRSGDSMRLSLPPMAPATIAFIELAGVGTAVGCPLLH